MTGKASFGQDRPDLLLEKIDSRALFRVVHRAQDVAPGVRRMLSLDIEEHRQADGQFDADMRELQQAFLFDVLAPFLSEAHGPVVTPPQSAPPGRRSPRRPHHRAGPAPAVVACRGELTDAQRYNARLRRVLHLTTSVLRAITVSRAAARQCRTARKPLGPAPWLPTSRAPPPTRSCTAW